MRSAYQTDGQTISKMNIECQHQHINYAISARLTHVVAFLLVMTMATGPGVLCWSTERTNGGGVPVVYLWGISLVLCHGGDCADLLLQTLEEIPPTEQVSENRNDTLLLARRRPHGFIGLDAAHRPGDDISLFLLLTLGYLGYRQRPRRVRKITIWPGAVRAGSSRPSPSLRHSSVRLR